MDVALENPICKWVPKVQDRLDCRISQVKGRSNVYIDKRRCVVHLVVCIYIIVFSTEQLIYHLFRFFMFEGRENMLQSIEAALYPVVVSMNNYLSSYILIFLLIGVGLWYSVKTRFVQVRYLGAGMKKVFGSL